MLRSSFFLVTPTSQISSTTNPRFTLHCNTTGAPAVVSWLRSDGMTTYTNGRGHQLSQTLLNGATAYFESNLQFTSHPYQSDTGERLCIATATYVSANSSETNTSTAEGK